MHKCVRCSTVYDNNSKELLTGCSCGARVFVFIKEGALKSSDSDEDFGWLETELASLTKDHPVSVQAQRGDSAENLTIVEKGAYELDVKSLMGGSPLVVKSEKGIYYIKVPQFRK